VGSTAVTTRLLRPLRVSHIIYSPVEKDLKRIVKPVMESQPEAPAAIIADIVLIEHRGLIHGWLVGQIDSERKRQTGTAPRGNGRRREPDPRQTWLDLPEFQHLPVEIQNETLEGLRERMAALQAQIKFFTRPRRSAEADKVDKRQLKEMVRLEVIIAPIVAGDPSMTIGVALEVYKTQRVKASSKQRRAASDKRWGRT
jgi:hypothetical protein